MRKQLESEDTSKNLGKWIDLIFGVKSRGKEAVESNNVFFYLTYEENVSKINNKDEKEQLAIETQIYHFG